MSRPLRVPWSGLAPGVCTLTGEAARYVLRVHRLGLGDRVRLFDPEARLEADAEIIGAHDDRVELALTEVTPSAVIAERVVRLLQALPKGDKLDAIVRDATELGASELWWFAGERSVRKLDAERLDHKRERLLRIAEQAARQCGRGDVPSIAFFPSMAECLAADDAERRLLFDPEAPAHVSVELRALSPSHSVSFAIGPEGGFSPGERELAREHGLRPVHLGPFVLRTETVACAALGGLRLLG